MSGLFKSVGKAFKKIGKVIKKIAPVLIVAAAVYFGGSYLMASSGAGTAAAGASVTYGAGGVGAAFTKSAGVWKSFLGGLSSGTASKSAVAFAEGSFKASQAGMALSGQVAAGTAAVNNLSTMGTVGEAVSAGVNMAQSAFSSGADPQSSWGILWNGLNDVTAPAADAAQAAGGLIETSGEQLLSPDQLSTLDAEMYDQNTWMADNTMLSPGEVSTDSAVSGVSDGYGMGTSPANQTGFAGSAAGPVTQASTVQATASGQGLLTAPATTEKPSALMQMILKNSEERLQVLKDANDLAREQVAARARADEMKLWLTGGGMFLNTMGQWQQASAAEEERKRRLNFKGHNTSYDPYKGIKGIA